MKMAKPVIYACISLIYLEVKVLLSRLLYRYRYYQKCFLANLRYLQRSEYTKKLKGKENQMF